MEIRFDYKKIIFNKYFLVTLGFIIYMSFFDEYSWVDLVEYQKQNKALEEKQEFYNDEIAKLDELKKIETDPELLEKYAREKFKMTAENEILFIVE